MRSGNQHEDHDAQGRGFGQGAFKQFHTRPSFDQDHAESSDGPDAGGFSGAEQPHVDAADDQAKKQQNGPEFFKGFDPFQNGCRLTGRVGRRLQIADDVNGNYEE